jgi:hypothetical protein
VSTPIASADAVALEAYDAAMDAALAAAPSRTDATPAQIARMENWLRMTIADAQAALTAGGLPT